MSWHSLYDRCVSCGKTDSPHKKAGKCRLCADRDYQRERRANLSPHEKNASREARNRLDRIRRACRQIALGPPVKIIKTPRQPEWVHRLVTDFDHGLSMDESLSNWPIGQPPQRWLARRVLACFTAWRRSNPRRPAGSFVYEEPEW